MKTTLFILLLFTTQFVTGQTNCERDTSFYTNGQIRTIYGFDRITQEYCGTYINFDTTGVILSEGAYRSVDSVACFQCYEDTYRQPPEKWKQYHSAKYVKRVPIGEWKYYHENGSLKERGSYCEVVREYSGIEYPIEWEGKSWPKPVPGYSTFEHLKDGVWEYYDLEGNNIRTEEYICGQLVYLTERN